jgi:hypothetical protein
MLFLITSVKTVVAPDKKNKKVLKTTYFYSSNYATETPSSDTLYNVDDTVIVDKSFYEGKTYHRVVGLSPFQLMVKVKES